MRNKYVRHPSHNASKTDSLNCLFSAVQQIQVSQVTIAYFPLNIGNVVRRGKMPKLWQVPRWFLDTSKRHFYNLHQAFHLHLCPMLRPYRNGHYAQVLMNTAFFSLHFPIQKVGQTQIKLCTVQFVADFLNAEDLFCSEKMKVSPFLSSSMT